MGTIKERYTPIVLPANTTVLIPESMIGGFLCTTTGTLTISRNACDGQLAGVIINALAVTAGVYYPMPFYLGQNGGSATTAGGAVGTLGV